LLGCDAELELNRFCASNTLLCGVCIASALH
jgi:hypothetical protein